MRLSRALCVVLLLHLIALAGVYAFTYVKDHKASARLPTSAVAPVATIRKQSPGPKSHEVVAEAGARDSLRNTTPRHGDGIASKKPSPESARSQVVLPKAKGKAKVAATYSSRARTGQDAAIELISSQSN